MPKPIMVTIDKEKFKRELAKKGISVADIIRNLGINENSIYCCLKTQRINKELLFKITEQYNIDPKAVAQDEIDIQEALEQINKKLDKIMQKMKELEKCQVRRVGGELCGGE